MFSLSSDADDAANYQSYSPESGSEYGADSRSGSQSPSGLTEGNVVGPSTVASSTIASFKNPRKRRAQLVPINLVNATAQNSEADEFNSELPTTSGSTTNTDDEPLVHVPRAVSRSDDPHDKRIRLTSSSSTSSLASLRSQLSDGYQLSSANSCNDLADLDFGQSTPSAKLLPSALSGTIIADGEFELVGSGQECKAVHIPTQTIHHCMAMNQEDYNTFMSVIERLESAKHQLTTDELRELRRLLVPEETRVVRNEHSSKASWYMIAPDHQGSLDTFYKAENASLTARTHSPWSEQEGKAIFRQVVRLVSYCHQIGIYFGDFRLQKLVYTDRQSNLIRVLHLRNIYVAPLIQIDTIQKSSKCCPAYIAPELIRFNAATTINTYAAKPADVWSLGVLLYVLLTGRFPFYAPRPAQLIRIIRMGQWSFKPSDKVSRSARLMVHALIRQNPAERPSAKEILSFDWMKSQNVEPAMQSCGSAALPRPHVTVQIAMPTHGRLNEANPRIPQQLIGILIKPASERNSIYSTNSNVRATMENFANALNRSMNSANDSAIQVVPERPQIPPSFSERDSLNISVVKVPAPRGARS